LFSAPLEGPQVEFSWAGTLLSSLDKCLKSIVSSSLFFSDQLSGEKWKLSTVYGPCTGEQRNLFVDWLNNLPIDPDENWMIIGDFNFYRSGEDRKRPGGNVADMNIFNGIISNLGILEIPLKGRSFTWSNMHQNPLLE
jgi:hypothetical protein